MAPSKRHICIRLTSLLLLFMLILSTVLSTQALAAGNRVFEGSIELTGDFERRRFNLSTSDDDLFHLTNIVPGDTWQGKVHVKNNCNRIMEVSIISIVNDLRYDSYLFRKLDLDISIGDEVIYSGSYGRTDEPISDWYAISPGKQITFDITVKLPEKTGNAAQGRKMESTWTFEARVMEPSNCDTDLPYYVYYLDELGNPLLDTKVGSGDYKQLITEYAAYIPGYTPDAQQKSIILTRTNNEIFFIYTKTTVPTDPTTPSNPSEPSNPQPNPDNIKTGDDLTESNSRTSMWFFILFFCMIALVITYFRVRQVQKESASKEASKYEH